MEQHNCAQIDTYTLTHTKMLTHSYKHYHTNLSVPSFMLRFTIKGNLSRSCIPKAHINHIYTEEDR